ncbi:MAG: ASKHA domain-containing protein [Planctomycetota bacterium]|jgi:uncharacterized 2Fe-2S/4Fe-4S cluster protein (DUF4445 family)|nr:ASKHA domain-containing protein [Planctomycetota bacterium]
MPEITFLSEGIRISILEGQTILDAARAAGVILETPCNAAGICGKCLVRVVSGRAEPLRPAGANCRHFPPPGLVLACQSGAAGDLAVEHAGGMESGLQIHAGGESVDFSLSPRIAKRHDRAAGITRIFAGESEIGAEEGDTEGNLLGFAVDIGTTTLAAALIDLATGEELAAVSCLNPQTVHAHDVLGRIQFASGDGGFARLHSEAAGAVNALLGEALSKAGARREDVYEAVYSGNACMMHLAVGRNPAGLGRHPYKPSFRGHVSFAASDAGLAIAPCGQVYVPPFISGHVGADIVSGLAAVGLEKRFGAVLFIDIGTNGEMVLARDGTLVASSTAAGPAFEGMNISSGMRAAEGAIEAFELAPDGTAEIRTIGGSRPIGVCGSGLMDIVAELAFRGGIEANGRFADVRSSPFAGRIELAGGKRRLRLADRVYLTQKDIRQVQLAKAAIRSGLDILLAKAGLEAGDVSEVLIAGSFGYHLRKESLVRLGLLPPVLGDRVRFVGNTSMAGAKLFLCEYGARKKAFDLAAGVEDFNLADSPEFQKFFVKAMSFPGKQEKEGVPCFIEQGVPA